MKGTVEKRSEKEKRERERRELPLPRDTTLEIERRESGNWTPL